uniref:Uncharacterized protein n=2 Tax=Paracidobacterium acidisoli TaxID=2303751 RepID=A0A372ISB6_9BACT
MAWFTLLFGALLLGIGIGGQIFGVGKQRLHHPEDRKARKMVVALGSLVVGLWFVAFSAAHLLHMHHSGNW